jgi:hypothetical protein
MKYRYRAVEPFWTHFCRLDDAQKEATRKAWKIFKENPFDPRLRTHKIHKLSALYGRTIYAADIEGDLRSTFFIDGDWIVSVDIGKHDIYRR